MADLIEMRWTEGVRKEKKNRKGGLGCGPSRGNQKKRMQKLEATKEHLVKPRETGKKEEKIKNPTTALKTAEKIIKYDQKRPGKD